jgi:hypothetical protein
MKSTYVGEYLDKLNLHLGALSAVSMYIHATRSANTASNSLDFFGPANSASDFDVVRPIVNVARKNVKPCNALILGCKIALH